MHSLIALAMLYAGEWQFSEVTQQAGVSLAHEYEGSSDQDYIAAGAASADIDADGWPDLYVLGGSKGPNALYRNKGDGSFEEITQSAGVGLAGRYSCGAAFADVDGDGMLDLFVGGIRSSPVLFRNKGDLSFEDITVQAGLSMGGSTYSVAFADSDRDGDLDLFLSHWQTGSNNFYYENTGSGLFRNATVKAGFGTHFRPDLSFTPNFADINSDTWPDLLIASDLGHSQVFLNDGQGGYRESTSPVISDENGMGAALGDYDNDGDLDWFVSAIGIGTNGKATSGNRLYANDGQGNFSDATDQAGVREGYWGWAASFADFNNDGWLDLYHTNGFLGPFAPGYEQDPSRVFINTGAGSFNERSSELGLDDTGQGRGVVCFDYDQDGDLDIFVANNGSPGRLFRNDGGNSGAYLSIQLKGSAPNTGAIGARILVSAGSQTQLREVRAGNNFESQNPATSHFGLGTAKQVTVTIHWPDGSIERHQNEAVNRSLTYSQPARATRTSEAGNIRWLPHITSLQSGFQTQVYLKNFSQEPATIALVAYSEQGQPQMNQTLSLAAGEQRELDQQQIAGAAVSHVAVYGPEHVTLSSGYRLAQGATATAHVHESREQAETFYVYPGNWEIVYDGMALINTGDEAIEVRASLLDSTGQEVATAQLTESLLPRAKQLAAFNQVFAGQTGKMIKITTSGPANVLFLRGTHAGIEPGLLYQVKQIPMSIGEVEKGTAKSVGVQ